MSKNSIWATLTLASLLVLPVACDKESNSSEDTNSVTIDNSLLYKDLGIENDMIKALSKGDFVIVDSLLVYDNSGFLVGKTGLETSSMDPIKLQLPELNKQDYTVFVWQGGRYIGDKEVEEEFKGWKIIKEERRTTACLMAPETPMPFQLSGGYCTINIKNGKFADAKVTLEPVGSILEMRVVGFDKETSYSYMELDGEDELYPIGIRINPALNGEDRWVLDTRPDWCDLPCNATPEKPRDKFFVLSHGKNLAMQLWAGKDGDDHNLYNYNTIEFQTGQNYFFYADLTKINWLAPYIGPTDGFSAWKSKVDNGQILFQPLLKWGCDKDEMLAHINGKMWWKAGNDKPGYWEEFQGWHLWYYVGMSLTEQYLFETEDCKNLKYVVMCYWATDLSLDKAAASLTSNGYTYKGTAKRPEPDDINLYNLFTSSDGKTDAYAAIIDNEGWMIIFQPHSSTI